MSQKSASDPTAADSAEVKRRIVEILDANHLMSLATNRADGWPQVTLVNYFRDGRALYFLAARDSQKVRNIERDPRVSIAIGGMQDHDFAGLSMAARVSEVTQAYRIAEINSLIQARPAGLSFQPHPSSHSVAVLEARPEVVSLIDYTHPPGHRDLVRVVDDWRVESLDG